jgi:hypothetical protein
LVKFVPLLPSTHTHTHTHTLTHTLTLTLTHQHTIHMLTSGLGSVIIDSQPLSVAVLAAVLFKEHLSPAAVLGLALGVVGLLCVEIPQEQLEQVAQMAGVCACTCAYLHRGRRGGDYALIRVLFSCSTCMSGCKPGAGALMSTQPHVHLCPTPSKCCDFLCLSRQRVECRPISARAPAHGCGALHNAHVGCLHLSSNSSSRGAGSCQHQRQPVG